MGGLFSSGKEENTTTVDPYENMPDWLLEQYQTETDYRNDLIGTAQAVATELGNNPREVLGVTSEEQAAYDLMSNYGSSDPNNAMGIGNEAVAAARAAGYDPLTFSHGYTPGTFDHGIDPNRDFNSAYTDDVVDTTLAGMARQADRERLRREAQGAQVGGTSNTRTAVGNAVAQQLTGMNMAEVEAKLRDEAHRFGVDSDFTRAGLNLQEQGMADAARQALGRLNLDEQSLTDQARQFSANFQLDKASTLDDFATSRVERDLAVSDWRDQWGQKKRELVQEGMDEERNAKADSLSWLSGIFAGGQGQSAPTGSSTTTEESTPSTASQILGGASSIAGIIGMLSDERAKTDIVPMSAGLDALKDVTPATYEYKEGMPTDKKGRTAGLMAQDLEHIPGAVETGPDGLKRVDPYPVMATVVQAVKDIDNKMRAHGIG